MACHLLAGAQAIDLGTSTSFGHRQLGGSHAHGSEEDHSHEEVPDRFCCPPSGNGLLPFVLTCVFGSIFVYLCLIYLCCRVLRKTSPEAAEATKDLENQRSTELVKQ